MEARRRGQGWQEGGGSSTVAGLGMGLVRLAVARDRMKMSPEGRERVQSMRVVHAAWSRRSCRHTDGSRSADDVWIRNTYGVGKTHNDTIAQINLDPGVYRSKFVGGSFTLYAVYTRTADPALSPSVGLVLDVFECRHGHVSLRKQVSNLACGISTQAAQDAHRPKLVLLDRTIRACWLVCFQQVVYAQ